MCNSLHPDFKPSPPESRVKIKRRHFTTQQVWLPLGAVGCGAHTGEIQSVAQHGVHPAKDVRVAAGGQGRGLRVRALRPAGVVSLQEETRGEEEKLPCMHATSELQGLGTCGKVTIKFSRVLMILILGLKPQKQTTSVVVS